MADDIESNFYLELLRAYIDSTNDAIFVLCDEMKFLLCNHAGEQYFGVPEETLIRHNQRIPIHDLFDDAETNDLFKTLYPHVLSGKQVKFESLMHPRHAPSRWLEFHLNKVAIEDVPMVIVVARDISERKRIESDILYKKDTLDSLVREKTSELRHANEQKDKLFSIIAHDLRGPLSPILGYAEMIINNADTLDPASLQKYAKNIHTSGKQSLKLLTDLLDWSRLQLDNLSVIKKRMNVRTSAQNVINQLVHHANDKNISLANDIPSYDINADRYIVETVIRNLVNNAIKFTPENGNISLGMEQTEGEVIITVTDTGIGMSRMELDSALSAYDFTSSTGTSGEEGTGLGLPLCISLVEKHGGSLCATSEAGKGSTFLFKISTHNPSARQ